MKLRFKGVGEKRNIVTGVGVIDVIARKLENGPGRLCDGPMVSYERVPRKPIADFDQRPALSASAKSAGYYFENILGKRTKLYFAR